LVREAAPERPFVVAQLGQSLDGRIATVTGESRYINGPGALTHLHALRACVDAVVVGVGTIIADDPLLTVRRAPGKSPARVVIDPSGRLEPGLRWESADEAPCYVISGGSTKITAATHIPLPLDKGSLPPARIINELFKLGMRRLLIEGGARTISGFIEANCVDRLHILLAPVLIGSGKMGLDLIPQGDLSRARRPVVHTYPLGEGDVLFDCALSDPRKA
jgi:riboflavin-specific deaminase-like protein